MKSKTLLMGASALILSVAGANATEYKPFVGVTMGIQTVNYDFDKHGIDFPHDFISFGLEAGSRFGSYDEIYNGGFTLSVDTSTKEKIKDSYSDVTYAKIKSTALTATYDNYLRLSGDKIKRIDLVLGAGMGAMNVSIDGKYKAVSDEMSWSTTFVLKAGMDFELTKHITLSATGRVLLPVRDDYYAKVSYIAGGAIKYVF